MRKRGDSKGGEGEKGRGGKTVETVENEENVSFYKNSKDLRFTGNSTQGQRLCFTVVGRPFPQGSKKAMLTPRTERIFLKESSKGLAGWRETVAWIAKEHARASGWKKVLKPFGVQLDLKFYFRKPKKCVKSEPTGPPDASKLQRAVKDALKDSGVIYQDDSQVTIWSGRKFYGDPERVEIEVRETTGRP